MTVLTTLGELALRPPGFTQPKPLVLLAYLAIEGPQQRRHMAELLWPDGQSLKSLAMALSRLRQAAPGCWEVDGTRLRCAALCDAVSLLAALDAGDVGLAMDLYRGPFLAGVQQSQLGDELCGWLLTTRARLADRYRTRLAAAAERSALDGDVEGAADLTARVIELTGIPAAERPERVHVGASTNSTDEVPVTALTTGFDRLEHEQREAVVGLAVFAGGFRRDAAEAVTGVNLRTLSELLDLTWLSATTTGRLDLRGALAGFAKQRLNDSPNQAALKARHAAWFADLAARAETQGRGPVQVTLGDQSVEDRDNLTAALEYFAVHDVQRGLALAADIAATWARRGLATLAASRLRHFLDLTGADGAARSRARLRLAQLSERSGDWGAAESTYDALVTEAGAAGEGAADRAVLAEALLGLSRAHHALDLAQDALRVARAAGEASLERDALIQTGRLHTANGEVKEALACLERAVIMSESAGDIRADAEASLGLSSAMTVSGEPGRARWLAQRGLELFTLLGDELGATEASALLTASSQER
ncbi:MAG: hypothetical protein KF813_06635 [Trueperaceae bacterium]|nr:hypothetical protein [Trueperaceae bacterium]